VLIDLVLAGSGGLELTRRIRARSEVPILLFGPSDTVDDRVAGLDAGADDYLSRPFAIEELLARLRALRRGRALAVASARAAVRQGSLVHGDIVLDQD